MRDRFSGDVTQEFVFSTIFWSRVAINLEIDFFLKVASSTNDNQTTLTLVIADIDTSLSSRVEFLKNRRIAILQLLK